VLALAREATGVVDRALRLVTLSDGRGVLVDADCNHTTEDEVRDAVEGDD
jgi:hypothetical protein